MSDADRLAYWLFASRRRINRELRLQIVGKGMGERRSTLRQQIEALQPVDVAIARYTLRHLGAVIALAASVACQPPDYAARADCALAASPGPLELECMASSEAIEACACVAIYACGAPATYHAEDRWTVYYSLSDASADACVATKADP